jgi:hypothetical protein
LPLASAKTQKPLAPPIGPPVDVVPDLSSVMASMIANLQEPDGYVMMQWSVSEVANGKWAEVKLYLRRRPLSACAPCPANT